MSDIDPQLVNEAIDAIQRSIERRKAPSRYAAREILVGVGTWILSGDESRVAAALARLAPAVEPDRTRWTNAVLEELTLAVTEHVRSTDPRYLTHPRYDLQYTVAARERLEARLR